MLKRSFVHIPGVGFETERYIWSKGIYSWEEFLENYQRLSLPEKKIERILGYLDSSMDHLTIKDINFFSNTLPKPESWRLYPEFKDRAVFLDIETTGLSLYSSKITLIGTFDGGSVKTFIAGDNLDRFIDEISKYSLLITYNGALFDLPFIKTQFPDFFPLPI